MQSTLRSFFRRRRSARRRLRKRVLFSISKVHLKGATTCACGWTAIARGRTFASRSWTASPGASESTRSMCSELGSPVSGAPGLCVSNHCSDHRPGLAARNAGAGVPQSQRVAVRRRASRDRSQGCPRQCVSWSLCGCRSVLRSPGSRRSSSRSATATSTLASSRTALVRRRRGSCASHSR